MSDTSGEEREDYAGAVTAAKEAVAKDPFDAGAYVALRDALGAIYHHDRAAFGKLAPTFATDRTRHGLDAYVARCIEDLPMPEGYVSPRSTLVGVNGNVFAIVGTVRARLRDADNDRTVIEEFTRRVMPYLDIPDVYGKPVKTAMGDYDHSLRVAMRFVGDLDESEDDEGDGQLAGIGDEDDDGDARFQARIMDGDEEAVAQDIRRAMDGLPAADEDEGDEDYQDL